MLLNLSSCFESALVLSRTKRAPVDLAFLPITGIVVRLEGFAREGWVVGNRKTRPMWWIPSALSVVREIFGRNIAVYPLARLAAKLNQRGLKGLQGGEWSRQLLR